MLPEKTLDPVTVEQPPAAGTITLRQSVEIALDQYFNHLDGQDPSELYQLVLEEVELPLLKAILKYTRGNQCKAAIMLGISRGTLRKKMHRYGLI